jgi:hypothetical protein
MLTLKTAGTSGRQTVLMFWRPQSGDALRLTSKLRQKLVGRW